MKFMRFTFFCTFFSIGLAAITISILVEELHNYYRNYRTVYQIKNSNEKIEKLLPDIEKQLQIAKTDPNRISRLRHILFGDQLKKEGTVFPNLEDKRITKIAELLIKLQQTETQNIPAVPEWIKRVSNYRIRLALFFAGTGLILLDFIFFGKPHKSQPAS
jgi:hypothetical protein